MSLGVGIMDWIFWLVLIIVLTIIEVATVNLLTIWFVISGIVTLLIAIFVNNVVIETTVFIILGVILLFTTRPVFTKLLQGKNEKTNLDRVVGMRGIVTEEIKKHQVGEVKVDGKKWSAVSDKTIKVGEEVTILKIEGVKLIVEKVGE